MFPPTCCGTLFTNLLDRGVSLRPPNTGFCSTLTRQQINWLLRDALPHDGREMVNYWLNPHPHGPYGQSAHTAPPPGTSSFFGSSNAGFHDNVSWPPTLSSLRIRKMSAQTDHAFCPLGSRNAPCATLHCQLGPIHFIPCQTRGSEGLRFLQTRPWPTPVIMTIRVVSRGWIRFGVGESVRRPLTTPPDSDIGTYSS